MAKLRFTRGGTGLKFDVEISRELATSLQNLAKENQEPIRDLVRRILTLGLAAEREARNSILEHTYPK